MTGGEMDCPTNIVEPFEIGRGRAAARRESVGIAQFGIEPKAIPLRSVGMGDAP